MPLARSASTVKSAVRAISQGRRNSPKGTAKNRKANGNATTPAARQPANAGTLSTMSPTRANWLAGFTAATSPTSQIAATAATANSAEGAGFIDGAAAFSAARWRHSSQSAMTGTK